MRLNRRSAARFPEAEGRSGEAVERVVAREEEAAKRLLDGGLDGAPEGGTGEEPVSNVERLRAQIVADLAREAARLRAEIIAELEASLERKATELGERLGEESARRHQELAAWLGEETERTRLDAQAQLAKHAAALERAEEERVRRAEAGAKAEQRVLNQAEELYSKAERALAQTDALAEQLAELSSSLGVQRAERARNGIRTDAGMRAGTRGAPLDANEATLDELRDLELSLTQATRMIEYRDSLGGFSSLEQLDEVPGISKRLRAALKRRLTIRTAGAGVTEDGRAPAGSARARSGRRRARR